jgi:phosphoglycolate phosphatase/putative hydrolase of the HAD superfamily
LEAIGVSEFFPEIIGLDSTGLSKPHYLPFSMALQKMGVEAKNCVAVGDRFNIDIELPVKMGMGGILVDGVEDVYLFN